MVNRIIFVLIFFLLKKYYQVSKQYRATYSTPKTYKYYIAIKYYISIILLARCHYRKKPDKYQGIKIIRPG